MLLMLESSLSSWHGCAPTIRRIGRPTRQMHASSQQTTDEANRYSRLFIAPADSKSHSQCVHVSVLNALLCFAWLSWLTKLLQRQDPTRPWLWRGMEWQWMQWESAFHGSSAAMIARPVTSVQPSRTSTPLPDTAQGHHGTNGTNGTALVRASAPESRLPARLGRRCGYYPYIAFRALSYRGFWRGPFFCPAKKYWRAMR